MFLQPMPAVFKDVLTQYPTPAQTVFEALRRILLEEAQKHQLGKVEESLKWGEPSFATKNGSPLRIHWRAVNPDTISIYVHCQTKLLDTFKQLYPKAFDYAGNREMRLSICDSMPEATLRHCFCIAMNYHKLKDKPLLGQSPQA